jgi:hypothetical protein
MEPEICGRDVGIRAVYSGRFFNLLYYRLAYFLTKLSIGRRGFVFPMLANTRDRVLCRMRQYPLRRMCGVMKYWAITG